MIDTSRMTNIKNLNKLLTQITKYPLEDIAAVCELSSDGDVNTALKQGAVLLAIGTVEDDKSAPFRFIIGLPKKVHTKASVPLKNLFGI